MTSPSEDRPQFPRLWCVDRGPEFETAADQADRLAPLPRIRPGMRTERIDGPIRDEVEFRMDREERD